METAIQTPSEGLQKVTDLPDTEKVLAVFKLPKITQQVVDDLTREELKLLIRECIKRSNELNGVKLDEFYQFADLMFATDDRNIIWENNHQQICWAISSMTAEYGTIPPVTAIANKAELSRKTVHKHLKEFGKHPLFLDKKERFKVLHERVLTKLYVLAVNDGDVKAARLFLDATDGLPQSNAFIAKQQNNFMPVQINNTVLDQQTISQLNAEQLQQIEVIVQSATGTHKSKGKTQE